MSPDEKTATTYACVKVITTAGSSLAAVSLQEMILRWGETPSACSQQYPDFRKLC